MVAWAGHEKAPRWQAVALAWTLGATLVFTVGWFGGKWWPG